MALYIPLMTEPITHTKKQFFLQRQQWSSSVLQCQTLHPDWDCRATSKVHQRDHHTNVFFSQKLTSAFFTGSLQLQKQRKYNPCFSILVYSIMVSTLTFNFMVNTNNNNFSEALYSPEHVMLQTNLPLWVISPFCLPSLCERHPEMNQRA